MNRWFAVACLWIGVASYGAGLAAPKAGKTEIFPLKDVKPGLQATAWTVFQGTQPEPVPIEIIGIWKKSNGPNDVILAKMLGKAKQTGVAAGMSGSPVYIDGKLVGAVALRISVFSPDAICGITPIESMLEINDLDMSRPAEAKTPDKTPARKEASIPMPNELLARLAGAGAAEIGPERQPLMTPIETPLVFSGFNSATLQMFEPMLRQIGITPVEGGGASAASLSNKPVTGWEKSLNPGESVAGILVSGDLSITGTGTVTYNDGKRVLAFGHPFMSLGPVEMPMARSEVVWTLASSYQPTKLPNTTDIVGALHQDRFSGILGELGDEAPSAPVHLKVRSLDATGRAVKEKDMHFGIFVQQKWTPYLMMLTLANTLQQINEYAEEVTYRMSGHVDVEGAGRIQLSTMLAGSDMPAPPPLMLATWWGEKFNRLFLNPVKMPKLKAVECTIDLLPERRIATIDSAWTPSAEVEPGAEIPVKVFLRPFRGDRFEKSVKVKIPAGMPKGDHRILFSDAETLNRIQSAAASADRFMNIPETVALLNQERTNNRVYVSLMEGRATYYSDDKVLPSLPASMLNVLQAEHTSSRSLIGTTETVQEQVSIPLDQMVSGSYSLRITVK